MKKFRRLMLWLGLVLIALLTLFSIIGAFLGTETRENDYFQITAGELFNSIPLSVYWTVFGLIIAASIFLFPRLLKSPGLLAMHAGCVMIIAGSMWGSHAGHEVQRKYFGSERIRSSRMSIVEGYAEDKAYLRGGSSINQTLNSIEMGDFTIKYRYDIQKIEFVSGDKVFRQEPVVLDGQISLGVENSNIKPLRFFNNLSFKTVDGKEQAFDKPGGGSNPALKIQLVDCDGKESTRFLADTSYYSLPFLVRLNDFRIEYYPQPKITVFEITNPEKGDIEVIFSEYADIGQVIDLGNKFGKITLKRKFNNLTRINGQMQDVPGPANQPAGELLVELPGGEEQYVYVYENHPDHCIVGKKLLIRYNRTISDYISELEILSEDGEVLAAKDIEVNKPLHYGGYHLYQSSYQPLQNGGYATILSITSDSGLYCVFAGFFAMCAGIVYHQWIRPAMKKKKQKPEAQAQG